MVLAEAPRRDAVPDGAEEAQVVVGVVQLQQDLPGGGGRGVGWGVSAYACVCACASTCAGERRQTRGLPPTETRPSLSIPIPCSWQRQLGLVACKL